MNFKILLFSLFIYLNSGLFSENTLPVFSENEKQRLEYIFDYLFKFDDFAYTLFAEKPLSFEHICTANTSQMPLRDYCVLFSYKKPINFLEISWNLWQSKCREIRFNNYIFFEKRKPEYVTIILINKKAFSEVFITNKITFQRILGKDITEAKLLDQLANDKLSLIEALNKSEELLGILIGYGAHNSRLFQKKYNLLKNNLLNPDIKKSRLVKINKKLAGINGFFTWLNIIQLVRFMGEINHTETQKLIEIYAKANLRISKLFKNKPLSDLIIQKLNDDK